MITLLSFVLSIILWSTSYDYSFVLCDVYHSVKYVIWLPFFPLCCLSFCEVRQMNTLLSFVLSIILWSTSYDYPFVLCDVYHSVKYVIWLPFCPLCCLSFCELRHMITPCVVCHSVNYLIWITFWYLHTFLIIFLMEIFVFFQAYLFSIFK
jgi:hypothetical protein